MSKLHQNFVGDLNHELLDALETLRSAAGRKVSVSLSMASFCGGVRVNRNAMRRALIGSVRNAAKFMSSGGFISIATQPAPFGRDTHLTTGNFIMVSLSYTYTNITVGSDCGRRLGAASIERFARRNGGAATIRDVAEGTTVSLFLPQSTSDCFVASSRDRLRTEFLRRRW